MRIVECLEQGQRGRGLLELARRAKQMEHAVALLDVEGMARFDLGEQAAREVDERAQPRALLGKARRLAQTVQVAREGTRRRAQSGPIDHAVARAEQHLAQAEAQAGTEPDVERRGQHQAALAEARFLRDRRMLFDHADAMPGRA